ncbi:MAG: PEGA domain-containing protein [Deltaproteobacteria bacterium]|nr:PEGA domain-containing protein [Deltaproteobacteria bacterium]
MPRLGFSFAILSVACAGASNNIVVDQRHTQTTVDAHQEVHVDQRVHQEIRVNQEVHQDVRVGGGPGGEVVPGGAPGAIAVCPGLSVEDAGETRSGRALAMALLQVSARPWVDLAVDGVAQGRTPLVAVGVEAGPREITLTHPGYACTFRLHAHAGRRYSISADVEVAVAIDR